MDTNLAGESPPWQKQVDRYRQECIYKVCEQTGLDQATVLRSPELREGPSVERAAMFVDSVRADDGTPFEIVIRSEDDYVNATALCRSAGRPFSRYLAAADNKSFLRSLGRTLGMRVGDSTAGGDDDLTAQRRASVDPSTLDENPVADARHLIKRETDKPNGERATWVHQLVAVDVARWCSDKLRVAMNDVLHRYMSGKVTTEESRAVAGERGQEFLLSPARMRPINPGNLLYLIQVLEPPHHDVRYFHTGARVDLSDKFVIKFGVTSDWKRQTQRLTRFEAHRKTYGPICVLDTFRVGDHRGAETALKRALIDKGCLCTGRRRGHGMTEVELVAIDRKQSVYAELVGLVESAVRLHRDMPTADTIRLCLEEQLRADESHRETLRLTAKIQLELEASKRQTLQEEIARLKLLKRPNALEYMEYGKRQRLNSPRAAAPVQEPAALPPREPGPDDFCLAVHFPQLDGYYEVRAATRRSS